jgi:hypothetical protein
MNDEIMNDELFPGELNREEALKLVAKAEEMIQRFRDLDFVLKPEARLVRYDSPLPKEKNKRKSFFDLMWPRRIFLPDLLWKNFFLYDQAKCKCSPDDNTTLKIRLELASACMMTIDKAISVRVVEEGQGLVRKLQQARDRIAELESDLARLTEENLAFQRERFSQGRDDGESNASDHVGDVGT